MSQNKKQLDFASQLSFEDGKWHFTFNAWIKTETAADALIKMIEVIKPLLAENAGTD